MNDPRTFEACGALPENLAREFGGGVSIATGAGLPEAIEAAADRSDWPTARTLFLKYQDSSRRRWNRTALLAAYLMDWLTVLRAEAAHIEETGLAGPIQLPPRLARIAIKARLRLNLANEALDVARACRRRFPDQQNWTKAEARALTQLGDHEAALRLGIDAWRGDRDFGAPVAARALIALGRIDECERFLDEVERVLAGADPPASLVRARIDYWNANAEPARALEAVQGLAGRISNSDYSIALAKQAARSQDQATLEGLLLEVARWAQNPAHDAAFRAAGAVILYAHFACFLDTQAVRPWVELLSGMILTPTPARALCSLMVRAGEPHSADAVIIEAREWFPSALSLWSLQLQVLSLLGDQERLERARLLLKQRFPKGSYLALMSRAGSKIWDMKDLPQLLTHNLHSGDSARQAKFLRSLGEAALKEQQIDVLRAAFPGGSALTRAQVEMILAPLADRRLLETSVTTTVNFECFEYNRARTDERMARITDEIGGVDDVNVLGGHGMPECLRLIGALRRRLRQSKILTRESYADSAELVAAFTSRIERREAASVIRIGDGEGHFLPTRESLEVHRKEDQAVIQNLWWGARRMQPSRLEAIGVRFREAVENATILGLIPPWRCIAQMAAPQGTIDHRGIIRGVSYCVEDHTPSTIITSAHFPHDLHRWNLWPEIFRVVRSISYISSHNMAEFLHDTFGAETRQAIQIPAEYKYAGGFEKADPSGGGETLLDRHEDVCAAIDPLPGEVYLVAAGFLGKIYCEIVRAKGGIAIDIGSLADYWMGFATRRYRLDQLSEIGLPNALINDHVLPVPQDRVRITGAALAVRSTADCRYNIASDEDESLMAAPPTHRALLRVVGHPRCASGYMATLFTELGLQIGHETLLRDGVSSWMHAVADLHVPYNHNATHGVRFDHTVAHVRDPADAVPSIMLENSRSASFNFRRLHIMRGSGVDICEYRNAVERAVASLLHWYEIIQRLRPEAVFRVEEAEGAVRVWLAETDLVNIACRLAETRASVLNSPAATMADAFEPDGDPSEDLEFTDIANIANINNSQLNFGRAKPTVPMEAYANMPSDLRDKLEAYCSRFGYNRPW